MPRPLTVLVLALAVCCCSGCMMPNREAQIAANEVYLQQEGLAALAPGNAAPPLTGLTDSAGAPVELASLLEQHPKGVLLLFFPALDTPNSDSNLLDWDKHRAALEAKQLGLYAVCPSDAATAAAHAGKLGIQLPLLADPQGTVARAYGCLAPEGKYPQRTTVGIGAQSGIVYFHRGSLELPAVEKAFGLTPADKK